MCWELPTSESCPESHSFSQRYTDSRTPYSWEGTLLFWATVLVSVLVNTVFGKLLPPIEALMLVVHVLGFFAILIPLVYVSRLPSVNDIER